MALLSPLFFYANISGTNPTLKMSPSLDPTQNLSSFSPVALGRLSPSGYTTVGIILTLISVFGIHNHLAVILVLLKNRSLRTPVNLMLLNLSASKD